MRSARRKQARGRRQKPTSGPIFFRYIHPCTWGAYCAVGPAPPPVSASFFTKSSSALSRRKTLSGSCACVLTCVGVGAQELSSPLGARDGQSASSVNLSCATLSNRCVGALCRRPLITESPVSKTTDRKAQPELHTDLLAAGSLLHE